MQGIGSLRSKAIGTVRSPHFWLIAALMVLFAISYYADHFDISSWVPFGKEFFTEEYVHDLHRALFLLPMFYCAAIFRTWGAGLISLATLCIVLPRSLLVSPNPDPILRAVVFVLLASLASVALGLEQDRRRTEKKVHAELAVVHHELQNNAKLLMTSEERYRDLFESASDAIIVGDLEGNIVEANRAAAKLTGYAVDELARMNISEFLTPESFEIAMERQQRQLSGETASQRYELELIRKDGTRAIIESAARLITENGQPLGVQIIARDVTEERQLRENMQFYIAEITKAQEEERKRIARELHDETAQALTTLLLDIEAITRAGERLSEETIKQLEQLWNRANAIVDGVRRFSHELRPGVLDQLGLLPALEWLAQDMSISYGIDARVEVIGTERRLPPEVELVLFRIAQEALSNVRKHSLATKAVVRVEFTLEKVRMDVTDNGRGFELPERIGDFASMGKLGMLGMHERARLIDGSISVESKAGKGTIVAVEVAG